MKLQSKFNSVSLLVSLSLAACHVQAIAFPFDLERRAGTQRNGTTKLVAPNFYLYKTIDVEGSELMGLRYAAEFIWSGAFEFGKLKRISKTGKKSKNILKPGVQKCLAIRDKTTEGGGVVVDACSCTTGPCDKDNNINSPTPRFQWNIRGRLLYPDIYENGFIDSSIQKGVFGEKQLPFWYGWIESALSGKCLTYVPPITSPPPFTDQLTYGKIGDVVVKECTSDPQDFSQLWLIWIFKKDGPTRIMPLTGTHRWQTEDTVYFGCHESDYTAINSHPWYFRVPETDSPDISEQELDKFATENLVDFA
ncbi:hypothetical protein TWF192_003498 [Orbilia oligospora]|uniref:Ig-like domain-containing protein n=1 Tax=Orbilia oligospora TaxID=2813651 RepID=A0A6G1MF45_ORBOL|nr:hypothetical protein TWF191_009514 [Orbilia oligospora]KAF3253980.1 hypothetical protein TWF192_003498 [Orbilia oligospora]